MSVKYDDEICICLGLVSAKMPCGKIEGINEEEFNEKIQDEIECLRINGGK